MEERLSSECLPGTERVSFEEDRSSGENPSSLKEGPSLRGAGKPPDLHQTGRCGPEGLAAKGALGTQDRLGVSIRKRGRALGRKAASEATTLTTQHTSTKWNSNGSI